MRLFIALELPDTVHQEIHRIQQQIGSGSHRAVKWVGAYAFHITLRFLGEVTDPSIIQELVSLIREDTRLHAWEHARISLASVGAFPTLKRPQTLWVGIAGEVSALQTLYHTLSRRLEPLGFLPEQRPFSPHITIGRVRRSATTSDIASLAHILQHPPLPRGLSWNLGRPVVVQSILTPTGPHYHRL